MSTVDPDLLAFRQFLDEQIAEGNGDLTPEQSLELWRESQQELAESVVAVRKALADLDAGVQGRPLDDVVNDLLAKYPTPPDA